MTIREQIRLAYRQSGMTQAQIAARAGVSESTVLNILRGRNVSLDTLIAVAGALSLTTLELPTRRLPQNITP